MEKEYIKLSFVGDIMCKKQQIEASRKPNNEYNFDKCLSGIKHFFEKSDYISGNLETPITKNNLGLTEQNFSFNTPMEFAKAIKNNNINLLTTANNHALDRGKKGLLETLECLEDLSIEHIGTYKSKEERNKTFIKDIDGVKFAFISYTYGTNANMNKCYLKKDEYYMINLFRKQEKTIRKYNIFRRFKRKYMSKFIEDKFNYKRDKFFLERVEKDIEEAKKKSDYVIFFMHSGGQYNDEPEDYTRKLMKFLLDKGVNFVIGAHPHVVHGIEKCSIDKFGAYSLGNFYAIPYANPNQKDDLPDYSIILNIYFSKENKSVKKITYTVAKSVKDEKGYTSVKLAKDIYDSETDEERKEKIKKEIQTIIRKFSSKEEDKILYEYILY